MDRTRTTPRGFPSAGATETRGIAHGATRHGCHLRAALPLALLLQISAALPLPSATLHVWTNSPSNGPGTNWASAFHTIQGAVDAAAAGDTVLVTNGFYDTGGAVSPGLGLFNRVKIEKRVDVRSVNGPDVTLIVGASHSGTNGPTAVRCVYFSPFAPATLSGFTLTNGHTWAGGGDGWYDRSGGGLQARPGGVLSNCVIVGNSAGDNGGGAFLVGTAGGASGPPAALNNCVVTGNSAREGGGIRLIQRGSVVNNCIITRNTASAGGGGASCDIGVLNNSTLSLNEAGSGGGILCFSGATVNNCIVYFNSATTSNDIYSSGSGITVRYSCSPDAPGQDNITNAPAFRDLPANDFRLQPDSPCIDTGTNLASIINCDIAGIARPQDGDWDGIREFDMGAHEYLPPSLLVTNPPGGTATFWGEVSLFDVAGVAGDFEPAGLMWWSNELNTATGTFPAAHDWVAPGVTLTIGTNLISIFATNTSGQTTVTTATITRLLAHGPNSPTHFVATNGAAIYPYTSWETAARIIQNAIDVASSNDTVIVGDGTYSSGLAVTPGNQISNRVCVTRPMTIRSLSGPSRTHIVGTGPRGHTGVRCVYLGAGATLSGFTLTNGHSAQYGNSPFDNGGGAVFVRDDSTVSNCVLQTGSSSWGGGAYLYQGGMLAQCVVSGFGADYGGGVYMYYGGGLKNCILDRNGAFMGGGLLAEGSGASISGCLLSSNTAAYGGGAYSLGVAFSNSTFAANAAEYGGGIFVHAGDRLDGCILYLNSASKSGPSIYYESGAWGFSHSFLSDSPIAAPMFVDAPAGDYRLRYGSPCIDAGNPLAVPCTDIDGKPRPSDGNWDGTNRFDIGAYEYDPTRADSNRDGIPDWWCHGHGLDPNDPGLATHNPDGDPDTTGREWLADTDPNDAASFFKIGSFDTDGASIYTLIFPCSTARVYSVEWSEDLLGWSPVAGMTDLPGDAGGFLSLSVSNAAERAFFRAKVGMP